MRSNGTARFPKSDPESMLRGRSRPTFHHSRLILHFFAEFPELTVERKDGDVVIPWHGLGRAKENEEFTLWIIDATD